MCELFYQKTPLTVANHVGLAEGTLGPRKGQPFYDGLTWHRVVSEFVVQGGDGGRLGYQFPDECVPGLHHDSIGVLQMANAGPDTNGSQFCLMLNETERLNYSHTVFGHVVHGIEVLPKIQQGDTMQVKILRFGIAAQAFKADQDAFDALVAKANRYTGPRSPGPDAFFDDPDQLLPTNIPRASDFNHKLANFERFTNERIIARLLAKTPDDAQAEKREAFLHALAEKAKVDRTAHGRCILPIKTNGRSTSLSLRPRLSPARTTATARNQSSPTTKPSTKPDRNFLPPPASRPINSSPQPRKPPMANRSLPARKSSSKSTPSSMG